jgi:hypothetical protein
MDIELTLDERECETVIALLARGPFSWAETNPLIIKIMQQMQAQKNPPAPAEKVDGPKVKQS